jgi:hypothetical protein
MPGFPHANPLSQKDDAGLAGEVASGDLFNEEAAEA